jgi:hypothetical protein
VGAWATPNVAGRLFGLDPDNNPQASYLGRLFGARDLALAAGTLSTEGADQRRWIQIGLACDVADAFAGYIAGRTGVLPKPAAVMVTATALVAAGLGAAALAADGDGGPAPIPN